MHKNSNPLLNGALTMLIDFSALLLLIFGTGTEIFGNINFLLQATISAVLVIIVFLATLIPYLGRIFQLAAGAGLCYMIYRDFDFFSSGKLTEIQEENTVLWFGIVIALSLCCVGLHLRKTIGESPYFKEREPEDCPARYMQQTVDDYDDEDFDDYEEYDNAPEEYEGFEDYGEDEITEEDEEDETSAFLLNLANSTNSYSAAVERTRHNFDAIKSGRYAISDEQLTLIGSIAEEFEALINKASDIFTEFDDCGGNYDAAPSLDAVTEGILSLSAVLLNIIGKLPLAEERALTAETESDKSAYFNGCKNLDELKKRYKSLSKIFHPDTETGDTESMQRLNDEFEQVKQSLKKRKGTPSP